jgi:REP element-mobilizing transposase RayT
MPHTYSSIHVHIIFATKERVHIIPAELQPRLWAYMDAIAKRLDVGILAIGGFDDHAHLGLILPPKNTDVSAIVQKIKANSSRWLNAEHIKGFQWQEDFGAFSISISHTKALVRYIQTQREHHRNVSFVDEYARILKKHGLS